MGMWPRVGWNGGYSGPGSTVGPWRRLDIAVTEYRLRLEKEKQHQHDEYGEPEPGQYPCGNWRDYGAESRIEPHFLEPRQKERFERLEHHREIWLAHQ